MKTQLLHISAYKSYRSLQEFSVEKAKLWEKGPKAVLFCCPEILSFKIIFNEISSLISFRILCCYLGQVLVK